MSATFRNIPAGLAILLLMAAGCRPTRDELFTVQALAVAGQAMPVTPIPTAGTVAGTGGVSGATPAAGVGAAGSTAVVSTSGLNPGINFEWTQTVPGAGACQAGRFIGTSQCMIDSLIAMDKLDGLITIVLRASSEAQVLPIEQGQLVVYDANKSILLTAPLTGALDCATRLLSVEIPPTQTVAMPIDRQLTWLNFMERQEASGNINGTLDPDTQTIKGNMQLVFAPMPMCPGTFSIRFAP